MSYYHEGVDWDENGEPINFVVQSEALYSEEEFKKFYHLPINPYTPRIYRAAIFRDNEGNAIKVIDANSDGHIWIFSEQIPDNAARLYLVDEHGEEFLAIKWDTEF